MIKEERRKYMKEYRQKNKDKLSKQAKVKRERTREQGIKYQKEWRKKNPHSRKGSTWREDSELKRIRTKTRKEFGYLKKRGICDECGKKVKVLEFHHLEPYAYDNFRILCVACHHKIHEKVILEMSGGEQ